MQAIDRRIPVLVLALALLINALVYTGLYGPMMREYLKLKGGGPQLEAAVERRDLYARQNATLRKMRRLLEAEEGELLGRFAETPSFGELMDRLEANGGGSPELVRYTPLGETVDRGFRIEESLLELRGDYMAMIGFFEGLDGMPGVFVPGDFHMDSRGERPGVVTLEVEIRAYRLIREDWDDVP